MAYMNAKKKAELMPGIKTVLKKYGVKATFRVRNHSTLIATIREGMRLPVNAEYFSEHTKRYGASINPYHFKHHYRDAPRLLGFLTELHAAMMDGNHDNSDPMTDYFDVGWYIEIDFIGDLVYPVKYKEAA